MIKRLLRSLKIWIDLQLNPYHYPKGKVIVTAELSPTIHYDGFESREVRIHKGKQTVEAYLPVELSKDVKGYAWKLLPPECQQEVLHKFMERGNIGEIYVESKKMIAA